MLLHGLLSIYVVAVAVAVAVVVGSLDTSDVPSASERDMVALEQHARTSTGALLMGSVSMLLSNDNSGSIAT